MLSGEHGIPSDRSQEHPSKYVKHPPSEKEAFSSLAVSCQEMIDTHCHLTFPGIAERVEEILAECRAEGVRGVITIATTSIGCAENLAIAREHEGVWCSAGVHPLYSDHEIDWNMVHDVGEDPLCVAWGELGLDNFHDHPKIKVQRSVLEEHLSRLESWMNEGLTKPVVLHCRDAYADLIPILAASSLPADRFVFHCFTGTPEEARFVLDFGAMISFTGVVTYKNAAGVADAAAFVPEDRIMVETDAPYLSPEPVRGKRPNVPVHVMHTARFIADRRGVDFNTFERVLDDNAERFFGIVLPGP